MRTTIHIVSARDYPLFAAGVRNARRAWWLRAGRHDVAEADMQRAASLLRRHLENGPRRQSDLVKILESGGLPRIAWSGVGLWLDMVRIPPSGTWERRRADLFGLAETWLGPSSSTEAEGIEHLVRRYLRGFGPAGATDVASWAGLPVKAIGSALDRMTLRRFRDEGGGTLFDVPRAPLPRADTPAPVRFLPTWDAALLVHARRARILPEEYRNLVFDTKTPHSVPTFLVDGAVAGTWRYEAGRVSLHPFGSLSRRDRRELDDEGARLARFHAD